jgi:uncharacterized membrane protein YjjB (DUF3815 family)
MVFFSCCAFAANRAASIVLPGRTDIISAAGAFVIGLLGNLYSRVVGGTAFTSMVTGVLFLVPVSAVVLLCFRYGNIRYQSGIAQGGGVTQTYHSSAEQYSSGFSLALRMITVAAGVSIGLFVSQFIGMHRIGHFCIALADTLTSISIWHSQKWKSLRVLMLSIRV